MTKGEGASGIGAGIAGGAIIAAWWADPEQTMSSIDWAWRFVIGVVERSPANTWTVLLAVLAGWLVLFRTSRLPLSFISERTLVMVSHIAGAAASFAVVWVLWREPLGLIIGAIVGLSAPYSWAFLIIVMEVLPWKWSARWAAELRGEGRQLHLFRKSTYPNADPPSMKPDADP